MEYLNDVIMTSLKPCPFCGNEAEITERYHTSEGYFIHVGCPKCFCKITKNLWFDYNKSTIQHNIDVMVKKWNTRATVDWMEGTYEVDVSEDGDTAFDVIGG